MVQQDFSNFKRDLRKYLFIDYHRISINAFLDQYITDFILLFDPENEELGKMSGSKSAKSIGRRLKQEQLAFGTQTQLTEVNSERSSIFFFGMVTFLEVVGRSYNTGISKIIKVNSRESKSSPKRTPKSKFSRHSKFKNLSSQLQIELFGGFYGFLESSTYTELVNLIELQEETIVKKHQSLSQVPQNDLENLKIIRMIVLTFKLLYFFNQFQIRDSLDEMTLDPLEEASQTKKLKKIEHELSEFMKDCFENDSPKEKYVSEELFIIPLLKNLHKFYFSVDILAHLKPILGDLELFTSFEYIEESEYKFNLLNKNSSPKPTRGLDVEHRKSNEGLKVTKKEMKIRQFRIDEEAKRTPIVEITEDEIEEFAEDIARSNFLEKLKKNAEIHSQNEKLLKQMQSMGQIDEIHTLMNHQIPFDEKMELENKDVVELLEEEDMIESDNDSEKWINIGQSKKTSPKKTLPKATPESKLRYRSRKEGKGSRSKSQVRKDKKFGTMIKNLKANLEQKAEKVKTKSNTAVFKVAVDKIKILQNPEDQLFKSKNNPKKSPTNREDHKQELINKIKSRASAKGSVQQEYEILKRNRIANNFEAGGNRTFRQPRKKIPANRWNFKLKNSAVVDVKPSNANRVIKGTHQMKIVSIHKPSPKKQDLLRKRPHPNLEAPLRKNSNIIMLGDRIALSESERPLQDSVRKQMMDHETRKVHKIEIEESVDELHEIHNGVLKTKKLVKRDPKKNNIQEYFERKMSQDLPTVMNVFKHGCNSEKSALDSKIGDSQNFNLVDLDPSEDKSAEFVDFYDQQMYYLQKQIVSQFTRVKLKRKKSYDFHEFSLGTLNHIIFERNSRRKKRARLNLGSNQNTWENDIIGYETPEPSIHDSQVNKYKIGQNLKNEFMSPVEEEIKLKRYSSAIPEFSQNKVKGKNLKFSNLREKWRLKKQLNFEGGTFKKPSLANNRSQELIGQKRSQEILNLVSLDDDKFNELQNGYMNRGGSNESARGSVEYIDSAQEDGRMVEERHQNSDQEVYENDVGSPIDDIEDEDDDYIEGGEYYNEIINEKRGY